MHFQNQLVIAVVALASLHLASAIPPALGLNACNSSSLTCPANSTCNIVNPCRYGRQCNCNAGYREYSYYNSTAYRTIYQCVPATIMIDDRCVSNGPTTAGCAGLQTYCSGINNTCLCNFGYVANSDGMDCSSSAPVRAPTPIGGNCTGNFCGFGATCTYAGNVCQCQPGYKPYNSTHCTHYKPGDSCNSATECDFNSCARGSCKTGSYQCTPGLKWVQWNPNNDNNIVDGQCIENTVSIVGAGQYCGTSDIRCDNGLSCSTCPEASGVSVCIGNGVSRQVTGSTLYVAMATVLLTLATANAN